MDKSQGDDRGRNSVIQRINKEADYINTHLDRMLWSNRLDTEIFKQFLEFFNRNMQ